MDEKTKSAIDILTAALGSMAKRCMEAEQERDQYACDLDYWEANYKEKDRQFREVTEKLAAEVAEHQKTRQALQYALTPDRKGEG